MKIICIVFVFLIFAFSTLAQTSVLSEPYVLRPPSLISILSNPEKYDGKRVRVTGFLHFQFEDSALYFSKDAADYLILENAIWVRYNEKPSLEPQISQDKLKNRTINLDYFDGRYVMLEGTFKMNERGHLGAFSGTLENVTRVLENRRFFDGRKKLEN